MLKPFTCETYTPRRAGLQYIHDNPSQVGPFSEQSLVADQGALDAEVARVKAVVSACAQKEANCEDIIR